MDSAGYVTLTRMSGLGREMQSIANNIANASTVGFRGEGLLFSEFVRVQDGEGLSMANANIGLTNGIQGELQQTGGTFDFAIEGDGFFQLETPQGAALSRAGAFTPNALGELVNADGHRVLDAGGAAIFIPPDAKVIHAAPDGTLSADGQPIAQLGVFLPDDLTSLERRDGVTFTTDAAILAVEDSVIVQGFLEGSNVDAVSQIARMIEVQHAYTMGQSFAENEDERIKSVIATLGR